VIWALPRAAIPTLETQISLQIPGSHFLRPE